MLTAGIWYISEAELTRYDADVIYRGILTGILPEPEEPDAQIPGIKSVKVFPNPISDKANIHIDLKSADKLKIKVYNIKGQLVRSLTDDNAIKGLNSYTWDCKDSQNKKLSTGVYIILTKTSTEESINKILLVK